jgi:hypothetical protein
MADDGLEPSIQAGGLALAGGLFAMGILFLAAPRAASRVFGLPRDDGALPYVRALSFRDLGIAAALALATRGPRRSLATLAASLAVIPLADAALVAKRRGRRAWAPLVLHAASAAGLLSLAAGRCRRPASAVNRPVAWP